MKRELVKILMDAEKGLFEDYWRISSEELPLGAEGWSIEKKRLRGGLQDGVDIVEVNNGRLSFTVVPTRGMGVWKGKFEGYPLGWESPVKIPVHPRHVRLEDRGGLGFLDGFNEWIVRCGLESNGAPGEDTIIDNMGNEKKVDLNLHGKIANIPADYVAVKIGLDPPYELSVVGTVCERSMFGANLCMASKISTNTGCNWISIEDLVENRRSTPWEMQLLYHCNYGSPFLEDGSKLVAAVRTVAPRDGRAEEGVRQWNAFGPPQPGFVEQVYFVEPVWDEDGRTRVMLTNKKGNKATSISFLRSELPYFTLWKCTSGLQDGYVVGLEPATNYPNRRKFERTKGRVVKLGAGKTYGAKILIEVHFGEPEVSKIEGQINKLQGGVKPTILGSSDRRFSE
ncbi:MAG: aldose 1-epimerase family protein [Candidatus Brockarchaeota archaeon]|nr:aldose 1-epimerase family protein [Candidatus Brockarchaeota archaeon]